MKKIDGSERMKTILMINPHAGRQTILKEFGEVERCLEEAGAEMEAIVTTNLNQARQVVNRAAKDPPDVLICSGGDGTLSQTVHLLLEAGAQVPLGYIPAGTTNDFANSLGLPKEPPKAAKLIVSSTPRPLDIGRFEDRSFIYVASFGAFTQSSYSTDRNMKNALGHFAYVLEGLKELPVLKSYQVRVETAEGGVYEGNYIFGSVSNSTSFGGIVKLDPAKVDLSDGKFELILIKTPKNLLELNRVLLSLMSGKMDEEMITFVPTEGAKFFCSEPMPWSLDGEYAEGGEEIGISVLPSAVKIFY